MNNILVIGSEGMMGKLMHKLFSSSFNMNYMDIVNSSQKDEDNYLCLNLLETSNDKIKKVIDNIDVIILCTPTKVSIEIIKKMKIMKIQKKLIIDTSSIKTDITKELEGLTKTNEILSLHFMFAPNVSLKNQNVIGIEINKNYLTKKIISTIKSSGLNYSKSTAKDHDSLTTITISLNHILAFLIANAYNKFDLNADDSKPFLTPPHNCYLNMMSRVPFNNRETSLNIQIEDKYLPEILDNFISFLTSYKQMLQNKDTQLINKEFDNILQALGDNPEKLFENSKYLINSLNSLDIR
jgi:prephenate dehydrogenase